MAFRPRRTYAFEFVKHRSFPPRCARGQDDISENMQRIYGHDTRNKSPRIVISRGSEKSGLPKLENSRFLVAPAPRNDKGVRCLGRLQQILNHCHFERSQKSAFGQRRSTTNLAVGHKLRGRNPPIPRAFNPRAAYLTGCHPEWPSGREGSMHLDLQSIDPSPSLSSGSG